MFTKEIWKDKKMGHLQMKVTLLSVKIQQLTNFQKISHHSEIQQIIFVSFSKNLVGIELK